MSSSETSGYIKRAEFVDLNEREPNHRQEHFDERAEFERVESGVAREVTADEAYRTGLAEGERVGRDACLKEMSPVLDELRALAKSMAIVREERLADVERELIDVATEIARRILRTELTQDGDAVVELARACIREAANETGLCLHLAPGDVDGVRAHVSELELDLADADVQLRANALIEPGSVVLETATRVYDGRPERILGAARRLLEAAATEST